MKKLYLFIIMFVLALFASTTHAQVAHRSYKFLPSDVASFTLTNNIGLTNLLTAGAPSDNPDTTTYTNVLGTRLVLTNSTRNFLQDVPLWVFGNGQGAWNNGGTNGGTLPSQSGATISVTWSAGSGANSALTFEFTPVYNGVNEATVSGETWPVALTPTAGATQTIQTNVPLWRWPGAAKLRLRQVSNADTDASSAVNIRDISINGFVPQ